MSLKSNIQKKSNKRKQKGGAKGGSFVLGYNPSSEEYMYVVKSDEGIEDAKAAAVVAAAANSIKQDTTAAVVVASAESIKEEAIKKIIGEVAASVAPAATAVPIVTSTDTNDNIIPVADVNNDAPAAAPTADKSKKTVRSEYNKEFIDFQKVQKKYKETNTFTAGKLAKGCDGKVKYTNGCYYENRVFSIIYNNDKQQYGILKDDSLQRSLNFLKTAASSFSKSELVYFDKLEIEIVSKKECKMVFFLNGVKQDLDIKIKKDTLQGILKNIPGFDRLVETTIVELDMRDLSQYTQYVRDFGDTVGKSKANPKIQIEFLDKPEAVVNELPEKYLKISKEDIVSKLSREDRFRYQIYTENQGYITVKDKETGDVYFVDDGTYKSFIPVKLEDSSLPTAAVVAPEAPRKSIVPAPEASSAPSLRPPLLRDLSGSFDLFDPPRTRNLGGRKSSKGSRKARTKVLKGSKKVKRV